MKGKMARSRDTVLKASSGTHWPKLWLELIHRKAHILVTSTNEQTK